MRRFAAIFLLLFVFCQAFASGLQGMALGHGEAEEGEHSLMHWEGVAHHHDAQGETHQDNSDESVQHILADVVLSATAILLTLPLVSFLTERALPPRVASETSGPSTYPDGPRRPPRLPA